MPISQPHRVNGPDDLHGIIVVDKGRGPEFLAGDVLHTGIGAVLQLGRKVFYGFMRPRAWIFWGDPCGRVCRQPPGKQSATSRRDTRNLSYLFVNEEHEQFQIRFLQYPMPWRIYLRHIHLPCKIFKIDESTQIRKCDAAHSSDVTHRQLYRELFAIDRTRF